jgi:hypothetical protein
MSGLHVWFDEWVIRPGDDIHLVIEGGMEAARKPVFCLYPANRLGHSRFVSHR